MINSQRYRAECEHHAKIQGRECTSIRDTVQSVNSRQRYHAECKNQWEIQGRECT